MNKKILISLTALFLSTPALAAQYYFKYPLPGVSSSHNNSNNSEEIDSEENKSAWKKFAEEYELDYTEDFSNIGMNLLSGVEKPIAELPSEHYPNSSPYAVILGGGFSNIDSLSSIENVEYYIYISSNSNTFDISGLKNLKYTNGLNITGPINNLDSLSNLKQVNSLVLNLIGMEEFKKIKNLNAFSNLETIGLFNMSTYAHDISGLSNINSVVTENNQTPELRLSIYNLGSEEEKITPIDSDAWLCQTEQSYLFTGISQEYACDILTWDSFTAKYEIPHSDNYTRFGFTEDGQSEYSLTTGELPKEKYPSSSADRLTIIGDFTNVDSLSSLNSVNDLTLFSDKINNLDGLSNLNKLGVITIKATDRTKPLDLSGLSNINGIIDLPVYYGYNRVEIGYEDSAVGTPISQDSWLCQEEQEDRFNSGLKQDVACGYVESPLPLPEQPEVE